MTKEENASMQVNEKKTYIQSEGTNAGHAVEHAQLRARYVKNVVVPIILRLIANFKIIEI